jgi:hypothetical protein
LRKAWISRSELRFTVDELRAFSGNFLSCVTG